MGCSAIGSASGCYPEGWWFESTRPSHKYGHTMKDTDIIIIPKGTRVCPSELGHNNFYYPLSNKGTILTKDLHVSRLAWIGGGNLKAFRVAGQDNVIWADNSILNEI